MKITSADFEQLTVNSTNWNKYQEDWKLQEGRFEDIPFSLDLPIDYSYERAYWMADYPSVMFVKLFLTNLDYDFRVYYDSADDTYMVTTNYGEAL